MAPSLTRILRKWFAGNDKADPRHVLAQAISDIGDSALVEPALAYFDCPHDFEAFALERQHEPLWLEEERQPGAAELAFEVLWQVLDANGRVGHIDWADGVDAIVCCFDALFEKAGLPKLADETKATFNSLAAHSPRGEAMVVLWDKLNDAVEQRGRELTYLARGDDAHHPVLLKPGDTVRWKQASFAKGWHVLP